MSRATEDRKNNFKVLSSEEVEVTTAGTKINPSSDTTAVFVRVINNSTALVAIGMISSDVDANSIPPKGIILNQYASHLYAVPNNANEVFIDSDTDNTKVTIEKYSR